MNDLNITYGLYNNSIFLSVVYFILVVCSIYSLGYFSKTILFRINIYNSKNIKEDYYSNFFIGISILLFLSAFNALNVSYSYLLIYTLLILSFVFFIFKIKFIKKFNLSNISFLFFFFFLIFLFFDSFYNFSYIDDDKKGYFSLVKQYLDQNFTNNPFDWRKISFFPGYFNLTAIFLKNGNFYNYQFVDKFFGILLILLITLKNIKLKDTKSKYTIFFVILYLCYTNKNLTSTPSFLITAYIIYILSQLEIFELTKKKYFLFIFYVFSLFILILKINLILFIFPLLFLVSINHFFYKKTLKVKFFFKIIFFGILIFLPWTIWSYKNFNTLIFPILGDGNFYRNYHQLNINDFFYHEHAFWTIIKLPIYELLNLLGVNKFIITLSILLLFIYGKCGGDKKINLFILFSIIFSFFINFLGKYTFYAHITRQLEPVLIALIIYSLLSIKRKNKFFYIIILLCFFFKGLDNGKYLLNKLSLIFKSSHHNAVSLYNEDYIDELRIIENEVRNKNIFTYISKPYLLDFKLNNYFTNDYYNFVVSPNPGYPYNLSLKEKINYFKSNHINYILLEKNIFNDVNYDNYDDYIFLNKLNARDENIKEFFHKVHISNYIDFKKFLLLLKKNGNVFYESKNFLILKL
jgi:hypothetical protein